VMEQCGLTHMAHRIIGQLSKGYRQRVGLADALVSDPKILILDEPTGGLDPHQRQEVLDLIHGLSGNHTTLISSHVLAEVDRISNRVMIIQQGELLAVGKASELADQLQEAPRVRVEMRCSEADARDVVQSLSPGERGEFEVGPLPENWVAITLHPVAGEDPLARMASLLREKNIELRELTRVAFSLNELFLRITAQSAQGLPS
jgi:ABC-2 type transport system ATP-binding protein